MWTRLITKSDHQSQCSCLCLLNARITNMCHHAGIDLRQWHKPRLYPNVRLKWDPRRLWDWVQYGLLKWCGCLLGRHIVPDCIFQGFPRSSLSYLANVTCPLPIKRQNVVSFPLDLGRFITAWTNGIVVWVTPCDLTNLGHKRYCFWLISWRNPTTWYSQTLENLSHMGTRTLVNSTSLRQLSCLCWGFENIVIYVNSILPISKIQYWTSRYESLG